jgi:hypothetical protein
MGSRRVSYSLCDISADELPFQGDFGPFTDTGALRGDTDDFGDFQTGANEAQLSSIAGSSVTTVEWTTWEEDRAWVSLPDAAAHSIP